MDNCVPIADGRNCQDRSVEAVAYRIRAVVRQAN